MPGAREPLLAGREQAALRRAGASVAGARRAAAAFRLAALRGRDQVAARLLEAGAQFASHRAAYIYIGLVDERWLRKPNNAAETSSMPSVPRFPRKRTNPTRRLARGLSGRTSIFAAATCPAPKD